MDSPPFNTNSRQQQNDRTTANHSSDPPSLFSPAAVSSPFFPAFPAPPPRSSYTNHVAASSSSPAPTLASLFPELSVALQQQSPLLALPLPSATAASSSTTTAASTAAATTTFSTATATISSSTAPLLRIRLIELDSYTAPPVPSLDPTHSLFSCSPLTHVPIMRVWGSTPAGQHVCLHVHRYFPYFYVEMPHSVAETEREEKEYMRRLGLSIEKALREVQQKRKQQQQQYPPPHSTSSTPPLTDHLYSVTLHTATDFYGYHANRSRFIKLAFLSPSTIPLASSLLLSGALLSHSFQPYEAHIPYQLAFMCDAGLAGMEWMDVGVAGGQWGFRRPVGRERAEEGGSGGAEWVRRGLRWREWNEKERGRREAEKAEKEERKEHDDVSGAAGGKALPKVNVEQPIPAASSTSPPSLASLTSVPLSSRLFLPSTVPPSHVLPIHHAPRLSTCEVEADCSFYQLLNRDRDAVAASASKHDKPTTTHTTEPTAAGEGSGGGGKTQKAKLVRSLQLLWDNEKDRRSRWREAEQAKRNDKKRRARERRAKRGLPLLASQDDMPPTPLSAQEFSQSQVSSSPPRVLPPPSELAQALDKHLRAVARQERGAAFTPHTPPQPVAAATTPRVRPLVPVFDWQAVRDEQVDSNKEGAEMDVTVEQQTETVAEPPAVVEDSDGSRTTVAEQVDEAEPPFSSLLHSALLNADTSLSQPDRLPPISASQQPPADSSLPQPPIQPADDEDDWVLTQRMQQEMDEVAVVDEELLELSQDDEGRVVEREEERRREGGEREDDKRLYDDEEDKEDEQAEAQGEEEAVDEEEKEEMEERRRKQRLGSGGGGSGSGRGRIVIEDDDEDDVDNYGSFSRIRIPQVDGAGDSEPEHSIGSGSGRRRPRAVVQQSPSRYSKYAVIPLTTSVMRADEVVIPSTPPQSDSIPTPSPSPPSSSLSSPHTQVAFSGSGRRSGGRSGGSGSGSSSQRQTTGRERRRTPVSLSRRRELLPMLNRVRQEAVEEIEEEERTVVLPSSAVDEDEIEEEEEEGEMVRETPLQVDKWRMRHQPVESSPAADPHINDSHGDDFEFAAQVNGGHVADESPAASDQLVEAFSDTSTVYSDAAPTMPPPPAMSSEVDMVEDSVDEIFHTQPATSAQQQDKLYFPVPQSRLQADKAPAIVISLPLPVSTLPSSTSSSSTVPPTQLPLSDPTPLQPPPPPEPPDAVVQTLTRTLSHISATPTQSPPSAAVAGQSSQAQDAENAEHFVRLHSLFSPHTSQRSAGLLQMDGAPGRGGDSGAADDAEQRNEEADEHESSSHSSSSADDDSEYVPEEEDDQDNEDGKEEVASSNSLAVDEVIDLVSPTPSPIKPIPNTTALHANHGTTSQPHQLTSQPALPVSAPPSAEDEEVQRQVFAEQAVAIGNWEKQWSDSSFSATEPQRWINAPLTSTSTVHILATPPPPASLLDATWLQYNLPPAVNNEPFFSSLAHFHSHMQSPSAQLALAHYRSAFSAATTDTAKSLVRPPPSAVEYLPPFIPHHSTRAQPQPPYVGLDVTATVSVGEPIPLRSFAYESTKHLFLTTPRIPAPYTHMLQWSAVPPSYEQVARDLEALRNPAAGEMESHSSQSSSTVRVQRGGQGLRSQWAADDRPAAANEPEEDDDHEDERDVVAADESEPLRPASPKFEESYLSTLSYFLPTPSSSRKSRQSHQSPLPLVSPNKKRNADVALSSSLFTPRPPAAKRLKAHFNLADNQSPHQSFPSPQKLHPTSQLSGSGSSDPSLPTFAPAAAPGPPPSTASNTTAAEDRQHLTLVSVEMHACSRFELLPDPKLDPVCAILLGVRWDVHGHDNERREMQYVLLCPHVPQHGSVPFASTAPTLCPALPFPGGVSLQLFGSEMSLLRAFVEIVLVLDPDVLYSYEIQKAGLGYIAERAGWLGLDMCVELSRVRKDERKEQWRRRRAELNNQPLPPAAAADEDEDVMRPVTPPPKHRFNSSAIERPAASNHPTPHAPTPNKPALSTSSYLPPPLPPTAALPPKDNADPSLFSMDNASSDNPAERYAYNHSSGLSVGGRVVLNVWRLFRDELKLGIYTYENVVAHVLGWRVPCFSNETRTRWWKQGLLAFNGGDGSTAGGGSGVGGTGELWRLLQYYYERLLNTYRLIDKLDLVGRTSELARVFGIKFYNVLDRGSQFRVESMMLRACKPRNYVLPSLSPEERASQRAMEVIPLILEPVSRMYVDPVIVLDFQSLYPSMMIANNICFSTCLGKLPPLSDSSTTAIDGAILHQLGGLQRTRSAGLLTSLLKSAESPLWISPSGTMFTKSAVRDGVLPSVLHAVLRTRIMIKKSMRRPDSRSNPALLRLLNARQFGLKLISNVTYGYTAAGYSGRMPCAEIADAIVSSARDTLEHAIQTVESNDEWRAKVVYGDTDSLFVVLEGRTREEAFRIGREIADRITAMNPKPVRLQMEKVYMPCMLVAKKRYVGMKWEVGNDQPVLEAKGIEMVRRDGCPALVRIQENALRSLFQHKDISLVRRYVEREWSRIYSGAVNARDFIFAKEVRLGTYKLLPLAAVVATNNIKRDARSAPLYGERVEYVVIDAEGSRLMDKAVTPLELLSQPSRYRLSASYYIEKQLIPPLARLFDLLGVSVASWYAGWSRPRRKLYAAPADDDEIREAVRAGAVTSRVGVGGKKRTIDHYYTSQHCPACDALTNRGYCDRCRRNTASLQLREREQRRDVEERVQRLLRICRTCVGGGYVAVRAGMERRYPLEVECESRDCPVLFERYSVKEQVREVEHRGKLLMDIVDW